MAAREPRTNDLTPDGVARPDAEPRKRRPVRFSLQLLAFAAIVYFFVLPLIPGFRKSAHELRQVNPVLLVSGLVLELAALFAYSLLTRAALGEPGHTLSSWRMFRIQMSTRALSIVPGGNAAGNALGYRLLTLSGVPGPDAGFALATAGLGSAVVLNMILWLGLIISVPIRGVNRYYGIAAVVGIIIMGVAAALVFGLMEGQGRAERAIRWIARKLHLDEDRTGEVVRHIGGRLEELAEDRQLLRRVVGWAMANWLLDAAALWVFLRAFGETPPIDGVLVAFGLVNVLSVVPITPGGLGVAETAYISLFLGYGLSRATATLGVGAYRLAQLWIPILIGGVLYLSLRAGPWSIERRERLKRLRDIAEEEAAKGESAYEFGVRYGSRRDDTGSYIRRSQAAAASPAGDGDIAREIDPG